MSSQYDDDCSNIEHDVDDKKNDVCEEKKDCFLMNTNEAHESHDNNDHSNTNTDTIKN